MSGGIFLATTKNYSAPVERQMAYEFFLKTASLSMPLPKYPLSHNEISYFCIKYTGLNNFGKPVFGTLDYPAEDVSVAVWPIGLRCVVFTVY